MTLESYRTFYQKNMILEPYHTLFYQKNYDTVLTTLPHYIPKKNYDYGIITIPYHTIFSKKKL